MKKLLDYPWIFFCYFLLLSTIYDLPRAKMSSISARPIQLYPHKIKLNYRIIFNWNLLEKKKIGNYGNYYCRKFSRFFFLFIKLKIQRTFYSPLGWKAERVPCSVFHSFYFFTKFAEIIIGYHFSNRTTCLMFNQYFLNVIYKIYLAEYSYNNTSFTFIKFSMYVKYILFDLIFYTIKIEIRL